MDKRRIIKDQYVEPKASHKGFSNLTLIKRKRLQKLLDQGKQIKEIALELDISRSTIYFERLRMGSLDTPYVAEVAHEDAKEKLCVNNRNFNQLPDSYKKKIVKTYKIINEVMEEKMTNSMKDKLNACLELLELMGANPLRMRKNLSIDEIENILKLHQNGKTIEEITLQTKRSRSKIHEIIKKHRDEIENKKIEEIKHEYITNKWLNNSN